MTDDRKADKYVETCRICDKPVDDSASWHYLDVWEEEGEVRGDVPVHDSCLDET